MWEKVIQYLTVIAISMVKYAGGPISAEVFQLSFAETVILMIIGMMLTVVLLTTLVGDIFYNALKKTLFKKHKVFSPKTRRIVRVSNKWGLIGIAFLTPVLFSPIGGTLIAISFGEEKKRIIWYMFLSALFWAPVTTLFIHTLTDFVKTLFH